MAPASNATTASAAATAQKNNANNSSKNNTTPPPPMGGSATTTTNNKQLAAAAAAAATTAGGTTTTNNTNNKNDDTSRSAHVDVNTTSHSGGTDLERTLYRLTQGLPKSELRLMMNEADECEKALRDEIAIMEQALLQKQAGGGDNVTASAAAAVASGAADGGEESITIHTILESSYTPMDRYWTYSALVGRLRGDFTIPSLFAIRDEKHPDHVSAMEALEKYQKQQQQQQQQDQQSQSTSDASLLSTTSTAPAASSSPTTTVAVKGGSGRGAAAADANNKAMLALMDSPAYHRLETSANILAVWKKIFTNRAAIVFKKAVKPDEAPGYVDRILFPIDLSLIRKMIVTRHIQSYAALHQYIGLISHNCCKYNGRESDYGMVARDFEAMADHIIRTTVSPAHAKLQEQSTATAAAASAAATATATTVAKSVENKMPPPTTK